MRKINFFVILLLLSTWGLAQKNNVQSAAKAIGLTSITAGDGSMVAGIREKYDLTWHWFTLKHPTVLRCGITGGGHT